MKKHSKQRDAIYAALCATDKHPTATELYDTVRGSFPNISLATVYRNLSELSREGEVLAIDAGDGNTHFDARTSDHAHLLCRACRRVVDVFTEVKIDSSALNGCRVESYSLVLHGLCADCIKTKN